MILFALGVAAGHIGLPIWPCLIASLIGSLIGDTASYALGRFCHDPIMRRRPFSTHPEWMSRAEYFTSHYGPTSLIIGRFFGPLRATLPFLNGALKLSATKFFITDVISALIWSPFYLIPGYLIGANLESQFPNLTALTKHHFLLVIFLTLIAWSCAKLVEQQDHVRTLTANQTLLLCGGGFILLSLLMQVSLLDQIDALLLDSVVKHRHLFLDHVMVFITHFGTVKAVSVFATVFLGFLLIKKHYRDAVIWLMLVTTSPLYIFGLKYLLGRARPDYVTHLPAGLAFPSGHATIAVVGFGFIVYLLTRPHNTSTRPATLSKNQRRVLYYGTMGISLMILSRLYLGVHWPSDLLAGILLGGGFLTLFVMLQRQWGNQPLPLRSSAIAVLVALVCTTILYCIPHHENAMQQYTLPPAHVPASTNETTTWVSR